MSVQWPYNTSKQHETMDARIVFMRRAIIYYNLLAWFMTTVRLAQVECESFLLRKINISGMND